MSEPHSALAGLAPARRNTDPIIEERTELSMLVVRGQADDPALAARVTVALGAPLPRTPNTAIQTAGSTLLWLAPDAWLAVTRHTEQSRTLAAAVETAGGYALNISHGRVPIRLRNSGARAALASGCRLDLNPGAFPVDACAQTLFDRISVLLHRSANNTFDLYVPRSLARNTWIWLFETGCQGGESDPTM